MKRRKITVAVLLLCLCASAVSCGETAETQSATEPATVTETATETAERDTDAEGASENAAGNATETSTEKETEPATEKATEPPTYAGMTVVSNGNGTCTVTGVGTCTDACIIIPASVGGDTVTAIAPSAFYGCDTVTAVQLPETVTNIGDLAFAACKNLTYISVSTGNPAYRDLGGVLYDKSGTTLILYPASHAGSSVSIGSSVTAIAPMAFYQCKYLKTVFYAGTDAQWENIRRGSGNFSLNSASVSTASGGK